MNGKGDKRRPMIVDDRQLSFNWRNTFNERSENQDKKEGFQDQSQSADFIVSTRKTGNHTSVSIDGYGGYLRYS